LKGNLPPICEREKEKGKAAFPRPKKRMFSEKRTGCGGTTFLAEATRLSRGRIHRKGEKRGAKTPSKRRILALGAA